MKLFIYLLIFWLLLTINFGIINIVIGITLCSITTYFSKKLLDDYNIVIPKISVIIKYIVNLLYEIFLSSFKHIFRILSKEEEDILEIDLYLEHESILDLVMMANFITLTPGTLSLNVSENHINLIAMGSSQKDRKNIEKNLTELFEKIFK